MSDEPGFPGILVPRDASPDRARTRDPQKQRLVVLVVLLAWVGLAGSACRNEQAVERPQEPYNLLLITLDTVRADRLGAYGYAKGATPLIDSLARRGVRFDQAMSNVPLTLPSHATILSGVLPHHHGLRNNGGGVFPSSAPSLAATLSGAGYRTGAFVGAFVLDHRFGLARGFDRYDDAVDRNPDGPAGLEAERPADRVIDRTIAWFREKDARPFFAWVHLYDAHAPYAPPKEIASRIADPYDGEIAFVDAQLARLIDELEKNGKRERTIIAIVADHGESLGEHGELTHGLLLYQSSLRVPMIIVAPDLLGEGRVVNDPVSLADLAPTLSGLLGHPIGGSIDGRDLTPLLASKKPLPVTSLYAETQYPTMMGWSELTAVRRGSHKYIEAPRPELYDLDTDPAELHDLRASARRISTDLGARLEELRRGETTQIAPALDAEALAKLTSLGYVGGPVPDRNGADRADPKDRVALFQRYEEAIWALNEGRVDVALAGLHGIVREDPQNAVFRGTLARAFREQGSLQRAIELYRDAVAASPADPDGWYNLASVLREAGRKGECGAALAEVIRLDPARPEPYNMRALLRLDEGKPELALDDLRLALAIDPRNARALSNRGNVLRSMGKLTEAESSYRQAIEISPGFADPWNGLGTLEVQRDRPREALAHFDRALALDSKLYEALMNRAIALEVLGDRVAAIAAYRLFIDSVEGNSGYAEQRQIARRLLERLST